MSVVAKNGWDKVRNAVMSNRRPFFVYPWKESLRIDADVLSWMITMPLLTALSIALIPFQSDTDLPLKDHQLYTKVGMAILGLVTGMVQTASVSLKTFCSALFERLDGILLLHTHEYFELHLCGALHSGVGISCHERHRLINVSFLQHSCLCGTRLNDCGKS